MSIIPRPFQEATIKAAHTALTQGARRFLVADEVGLGKTIVALGVLRELMRERKPLRVFYVCNSLAIARQNRDRLLDLLGDDASAEERDSAVCKVDRLTLMMGAAPTHPRLQIFTITPATSFPRMKGRPRKGRWREREVIADLVAATVPEFLNPAERDTLFKCGIKHWTKEADRKATSEEENAWFKTALACEFGSPDGGSETLASVLEEVKEELGVHELIGRLRSALALQALNQIKPDIVILDEFQRFKAFLEPRADDAEDAESEAVRSTSRLLRAFRGDDLPEESRPALLLLSATPYKLASTRQEDATHTSHHDELFSVLDFLAGHGEAARAQREELVPLFKRFRHGLQRGEPDLAARDALVAGLTKRMARTERIGVGRHGDAEDWIHETELVPEDLQVFRDLDAWLPEGQRPYALPYWTSIPLPIQAMSSRYKAWKAASEEGAPKHVEVTWSHDDYARLKRPSPWPHPGIRTVLGEILPAERLVLPWVPPSRPWWPLKGAWAPSESASERNMAHKLLVFSRFRALPPMLSAALSSESERVAFAASMSRTPEGQHAETIAKLRKERRFTPSAERQALLAYFWPSPTLAKLTPQIQQTASHTQAVKEAKLALRTLLKGAGIPVRRRGGTPPTAWRVLAWFDREYLGAWRDLESEESTLPKLVEQWRQRAAQKPTSISTAQLGFLARLVTSAPGIVLARALSRREERVLDLRHLPKLLDLCWKGLRTYLDEPVLRQTMLRTTGASNAPDALLRSIEEGNLEAVLDEHLWVLEACGHARGLELMAQLKETFSLQAGAAYVQKPDLADSFRVACRAAMPFSELRAMDPSKPDERFRPDQLRKAFNSPFWPHVLVTTSVGQEGLDFHLWCQDLLHWDLPSNAVDLEQREGRIRRYCGLAVRRALVSRYEGQWDSLEHSAAGCSDSGHGLSPWWNTEGAVVRRHILEVPLSNRQLHLKRLKRRRVLYRLALGQPDQHDLIKDLERSFANMEELPKWALDLSPWFNEHRDELS